MDFDFIKNYCLNTYKECPVCKEHIDYSFTNTTIRGICNECKLHEKYDGYYFDYSYSTRYSYLFITIFINDNYTSFYVNKNEKLVTCMVEYNSTSTNFILDENDCNDNYNVLLTIEELINIYDNLIFT